jgi:DNA repair exonuclease SbcCD ATPase subunit
MGCSDSKEVALQELRAIVDHLATETSQLNNDLEKITSTNRQGAKIEKPPTVQLIKSMLVSYENNLKEINSIGEKFLNLSKERASSNTVQVQEVLEYSEELFKKVHKIEEMLQEKENLKVEEEDLECKIKNLEKSIKDLENTYFSNEELRDQHHRLHEEVSELLLRRDQCGQEVENLEIALESLNQEIKNSGLDDKASNNDLTNYEVLLRMTELEVNLESKKIDSELEQLAEEMKNLKIRENELQALENNFNSRAASRTSEYENLPFQMKKSKDRIDLLDSEQARIKDEISLVKKSSLNNDRGDMLREFAIRRKSKEEGSKNLDEKIKAGFQASLNRISGKFKGS